MAQIVTITNPLTGQPAQVDQLDHTAQQIDDGIGFESTDYPGCYYRLVNGVVEWFNPPMQVGDEYRTTERYMGKPVYIKLVDCGALPNATTKDIAYTTEVTTYVAHGGHFANGTYTYSITDYGVASSVRCWVALKNISIKCTGDFSNHNAYVWVKYTKETD